MSTPMPKTSFAEKLMAVPSRALYLVLAIVIIISVFLSRPLPNQPNPPAADFYTALMKMPADKVVAVQSDFTNSTRGESAGQLEALTRILVRRGIRFILYAGADPQAPTVATNIVERIIKEEKAVNPSLQYERNVHWVRVGNFTNLDNTARLFQTNFREAFRGREDNGVDVLGTPPFEGINTINDLGLYVNVTASSTLDVLIGRLQFTPTTYDGVPIRSKLMAMVTGVIGPEAVNYYKAQQLAGLVVGLNGTVELETLMGRGLEGSKEAASANNAVVIDGRPSVAKLEGNSVGRGSQYYFALHTAMGLLILAVIVGNVGTALQKSKRGGKR